MGRTGSALDNAVVESYHSTLEFELLSRTRFATRAQARPAVIAWIEEYNTERLHSANGMIPPVAYEHGQRRPGAKPVRPAAPPPARRQERDRQQDREQEHDAGGCAAR